MDYEKKYKKALERAATELETCGADESLRNMIYAIFPDELKESEDEQTRKGLINFLKSPFIRENICDWKVVPWIAWLEKQGELPEGVRKQVAEAKEALYSAPCVDTINGQGVTNQVSQSEVTKTSEQDIIQRTKKVYADLLSAKGYDLGTINSELQRLEKELKGK